MAAQVRRNKLRQTQRKNKASLKQRQMQYMNHSHGARNKGQIPPQALNRMAAWLKLVMLMQSARAVGKTLGESPKVIDLLNVQLPAGSKSNANKATAYHKMVVYTNMRNQEWDGCPLTAKAVMTPTPTKHYWKGPEFYSMTVGKNISDLRQGIVSCNEGAKPNLNHTTSWIRPRDHVKEVLSFKLDAERDNGDEKVDWKGDRDKTLHILKDRLVSGRSKGLLDVPAERRVFQHLLTKGMVEEITNGAQASMRRSDSISSSVANFSIDAPQLNHVRNSPVNPHPNPMEGGKTLRPRPPSPVRPSHLAMKHALNLRDKVTFRGVKSATIKGCTERQTNSTIHFDSSENELQSDFGLSLDAIRSQRQTVSTGMISGLRSFKMRGPSVW